MTNYCYLMIFFFYFYHIITLYKENNDLKLEANDQLLLF